MAEKEVLEEFFNLQTCSKGRLNKIKNVLYRSKDIIGKDLTKLKLTDITKFLQHINQSDFKAWTKNDYKKIFKNFLKWYYEKEFPEWNKNTNFKEGFKQINKQKAFNKQKINKETLLQEEELEKLLRTAKSLKWKALLTLMYESAFRPCEMRDLKWKDLNFDDSRNLCNITILSPKTKEVRTIPVRNCIVHLKRWRDEFQFPNRTKEDYVFPSQRDRKKRLSEGVITEMFKRISKKANMRHIFPYMLRHSRIYEIQKKLGARIASKFAGHSLETSEIYNHLDFDDVESAMLEKVYTTKELTESEKDELKELRSEMKDIKNYLKKKSEFDKEVEKIGKNQQKGDDDFYNKFIELQKEKEKAYSKIK